MKTPAFRPVLVLAPGVLAGAEKVVITGVIALHQYGLNPLMIIIKETRAPMFADDFKMALPDYIETQIIESTKAFDHQLPVRLNSVLKNETLPLIFHSHGFKALIACYMARGKRPHIHTHHGNTGHTLKVRIYEKIAMLVMKRSKAVIAVSAKMKGELTKLLGPYKNIVTIENMLSLTNAAKIRDGRKSRVSNENDVIQLIYIGRLSSEKGLLPFLECLAKCPSKDHFFLTILGDGVQRPLVETFITENNLSSQVKMHGFVSDPSAYLISPDLLIMPSLREGLPMTLIESLASGLPILANDVGAISSLVTSGHNGFLTKDFSIESWNQALVNTIQHYKKWNQTALNEAQDFENRFSTNLWAQKTAELYQSIL